jgi:hypothetical protein
MSEIGIEQPPKVSADSSSAPMASRLVSRPIDMRLQSLARQLWPRRFFTRSSNAGRTKRLSPGFIKTQTTIRIHAASM